MINIRAGAASRSDWSAWFAVEEVEAGTWLVGEPGHVNCFLIAGSERAVLVDTGLGIADIGSI